MAGSTATCHRGDMPPESASPTPSASSLPPPPALGRPTGSEPPKRKGRPPFGLILLAAVGFGTVREILDWVLRSRGGALGAVIAPFVGIGIVIAWRTASRRRVRARGGVEHTPAVVSKQLTDSGLLPPAFAEDGTIEGASLLVLNQLPKILEVETQYEVFGSDTAPLGRLVQIGQTRGKQVARVLTAFDQYFTHHFELEDNAGRTILRLTRPRKLFKTKVHVFDANNRFLGTWRQENVFWKIRWTLTDPQSQAVAQMRAANVRAWDFHVWAQGREVATLVKSWEGWGKSAFTRADRYVVRVNEALPLDQRLLLLTIPLVVDLSVKQDARGIS
jgi:hypothetical protein